MKNRADKIPAFTLTEVLVTLAISSILIIMAYTTYTMLTAYFAKVNHDNTFNSECLTFRLFLTRDVEQSDYIVADDGNLSFKINGALVNWYSMEDTIVRKDTDTRKFYLKPHQISWGMDEKLNYVNSIQVHFLSNDETEYETFSFYKNYPLHIYINK